MLWLILSAQALAGDCPSDLDGDHHVGNSDLNVLLSDWGGRGSADLDGSGRVDGADLSLLLVDWGSCPQDDWRCGDLMIDDRDDHAYETRLYGTICWMTENLDHGEQVDGSAPGSLATDDGVIQKFCFDDDAAACESDGALYSWEEATAFEGSSTSAPSDIQGACPTGWHLPSDAEYLALERTLGMRERDVQAFEAWRGSPVGADMKVGGASGFEGILVGWRDAATGTYKNHGFYAGYWTATEALELPGEAVDRGLLDPKSTVGRFAYDLEAGLSVRCVSDTVEDD